MPPVAHGGPRTQPKHHGESLGLPCAPDVERAILGSVLLNNDKIYEISGEIVGAHFSLESHRRIYGAMLDMREQGTDIDIVTLANFMRQKSQLEYIGGAAYLASMTDGLFSQISISHYLKILKEKALLRGVINVGNRLKQRAVEQQESAEALVGECENELHELLAFAGGSADEIKRLGDYSVEYFAELESVRSYKQELIGLTYGLSNVDFATTGMRNGETTVIGGRPGAGKALALDTPLPTPTGWTTMGEVKVGDYLLDELGFPCRVKRCSEVMYGRDVYEVEFDDGSTIVADADHQWHTFTRADRRAQWARTMEFRLARRLRRPKRGRGLSPWTAKRNTDTGNKHISAPVLGSVKTTVEILRTLWAAPGRLNHSIKVAGPTVGKSVPLPIHPYVLGAWLGDGTSENGGFSSADEPIIENIRACGYRVNKRKNKYGYGILGIHVRLRRIGVLGNKHIPAVYMRASIRQRMALLQGLMDTDGSCAHQGACEFCNMNERLARSVFELAASLGLKPTLHTGRATINGKDCGVKYRVCFTTTKRVFRLDRKAEKLPTKARKTQDFRYIVAVRRVDTVPVKCVEVDSKTRLYLASRAFIPTHNSSMALGIALANGQDMVPVYYYSAEMRGSGLFSRTLSALTRINNFRLRDPRQLTADDDKKLAIAADEARLLPVWIDDRPGLDITQIIARARLWMRKHAAKVNPEKAVTIFDFAQLIKAEGKDRVERVGNVAEAVAMFAREVNRPAVLLSQLNRPDRKNTNVRPTMDDLKESGRLEENADVVALLFRVVGDKQGEDEFIIAKQRNGPLGTEKVYFDKETLMYKVRD